MKIVADRNNVTSIIQQNHQALLHTIENTAHAAGKPTPLMLAVTKNHGIEEIEPLLQQGQRVFGENRVQEAASKWPSLRQNFSDITLHLIGPLQTNKVALAVSLFDVIQSVDREKLATKLAQEQEKQQKNIRCYLQVNVGNEEQKAGVAWEDLDALYRHCRECQLTVEGLMCIPPALGDPTPFFQQLAQKATEMGLKNISMGMSGDYKIAIESGSTMLRVGSALFAGTAHSIGAAI
ncbi:MAG: YggS family pyridoxal phosphate-dependent enzyme [Alphaproteobacteria bacterium]